MSLVSSSSSCASPPLTTVGGPTAVDSWRLHSVARRSSGPGWQASHIHVAPCPFPSEVVLRMPSILLLQTSTWLLGGERACTALHSAHPSVNLYWQKCLGMSRSLLSMSPCSSHSGTGWSESIRSGGLSLSAVVMSDSSISGTGSYGVPLTLITSSKLHLSLSTFLLIVHAFATPLKVPMYIYPVRMSSPSHMPSVNLCFFDFLWGSSCPRDITQNGHQFS